MAIPVSTTRTILADSDYQYDVTVADDFLSLKYQEAGRDDISIGFASPEEMRAVAFAMLDLTGGR